MITRNLTLPGSLRYQPRQLKKIFGYDNTYDTVGEVEIATLRTMGEIGAIPAEEVNQVSDSLMQTMLHEITGTEVDEIERTVTRHDIRAWVRRATTFLQANGLGHVARWLHVPLTSYDPLHTGRILQYVRAWQNALKPASKEVILLFADKTEQFAELLQVGRTHGQHALPITVGFWLATILQRLCYNTIQIDNRSRELVGKISGAVGAYNAQRGLGISQRCGATRFEVRVLNKLGLQPAPISTQILPPEPLAYFLHAACMLSASIGQFGRDCRHLMRSEIAEVQEEYEEDQDGSSTMGHKRNPKTFEQTEGMWIKTKNEYGKVFDTLISEHQRDLIGSSVERDFPIILVNLQHQLNTLCRPNEKGVPFLRTMTINEQACHRNFAQNRHVLLSEPLYIALIIGGYQHDAHKLVNKVLTNRALKSGKLLIEECLAMENESAQGAAAAQAIKNLPDEIQTLLHQPETYVGDAREKALEIVQFARTACESL